VERTVTPDEVHHRAAEIQQWAQADPEAFHSDVDRLRLDVLKTLADEGSALARAAVEIDTDAAALWAAA
jgi:hypothetical protein